MLNKPVICFSVYGNIMNGFGPQTIPEGLQHKISNREQKTVKFLKTM